MPTLLPIRPAPVRRLSWPETFRFLALVARVRWLDMRAHALIQQGAGFSDDRLLRLMRRWVALHEAIGDLLPGIPEPEHVREVRAILFPLDEIRRCAAAELPLPPVRPDRV